MAKGDEIYTTHCNSSDGCSSAGLSVNFSASNLPTRDTAAPVAWDLNHVTGRSLRSLLHRLKKSVCMSLQPNRNSAAKKNNSTVTIQSPSSVASTKGTAEGLKSALLTAV